MRGLDLKASRNRRSSVPTKLSVHLKARKLPQTSKPLPGVFKILGELSLTSLSGVSKLNFHMEIDFHSHWSDLSFWIVTAVVWRKVAKVTTKCWSVFCPLRQEKVITDPTESLKPLHLCWLSLGYLARQLDLQVHLISKINLRPLRKYWQLKTSKWSDCLFQSYHGGSSRG